jgi:hypothetical protein
VAGQDRPQETSTELEQQTGTLLLGARIIKHSSSEVDKHVVILCIPNILKTTGNDCSNDEELSTVVPSLCSLPNDGTTTQHCHDQRWRYMMEYKWQQSCSLEPSPIWPMPLCIATGPASLGIDNWAVRNAVQSWLYPEGTSPFLATKLYSAGVRSSRHK